MLKYICSLSLSRPLLISGLFFSAPAYAQQNILPDPIIFDSSAPEADDNSVTVGIGVGIAPTYDGSDNYRFAPGALLQGRLSGYDFIVRGPSVSVDLIRDAEGSPVNFILGPLAQVRLDRTGGIEDAQVRALGEMDAAVEIGARIGIARRGLFNALDMASFETSIVQDVSDVHDSYLISPALNYSTPVTEKTVASFNLSSTFVGGGYGKTYFDVPSASSSASGLSAYSTTGSGFKDVGGSFMLKYSLSDDPFKGLGVFAMAGYKRLLGEYADSPIVADAGDRDQGIGLIGLSFGF